MGCDIHFYLEYKHSDANGWGNWGERYRMGRNYALFGFLAGVRGEGKPIVEARGYPSDASWDTNKDFYMWIGEPSNDDDDRTVSLETALDWNNRYGTRILYKDDGKPARVANPDWHTPSWLTWDELLSAVTLTEKKHREWLKTDHSNPMLNTHYKNNLNQYLIEYKVILNTMETFNRAGYSTRVVFWFDN